MSVGVVNKSTGDRIQTAGDPLDKVGNLANLTTTAKDNAVNAINEVNANKASQSELATVETTTTASKAYSAGEYLVVGGVLYKVTANIAQGGTIVTEGAGKNVDLATVGGELSGLNSNLTSVEEWTDADAKTLTGNPITLTDAANLDAKALSMTVEPIQDLHGYDKPWVGGAGKNKCEGYLQATIDSSGTIVSDSAYITHYGKIESGKTYTISNIYDQSGKLVYCIFANEPQIGDTASGGRVVSDSFTFTAASDGYIAFRSNYDHTDGMLEEGSIATSYEPYSNICPISGLTSGTVQTTDGTDTNTATITFGQTVYGGSVDFNSGVMTVDRKIVDLGDLTWYKTNNNLFWSQSVSDFYKAYYKDGYWYADAICSHYLYATDDRGDYDSHITLYYEEARSYYRIFVSDPTKVDLTNTEYKTAVKGYKLCYKFVTPLTVQLTPQQIQLLKGHNTITANGAIISLTYQPDNLVGEVMEQVDDIASDKQDKTDNSLNTTAKTVVGGINELNTLANAINARTFANNTPVFFVPNWRGGQNYNEIILNKLEKLRCGFLLTKSGIFPFQTNTTGDGFIVDSGVSLTITNEGNNTYRFACAGEWYTTSLFMFTWDYSTTN